MAKMSDAELRVVMIVTRATFGWVMDDNSGMRKEEDWISHSQMVKKSGKSSRAISYAISSCVANNWIEARTAKGELLDTPEKRKSYGRKIYYRLGSKFLGKAETIANTTKVPSQPFPSTIANDDTKPSQPLRTTKETITKEILQKGTEQSSVFSIQEEIKKLEDNPRRDMNVIALFLDEKKPDIRTKDQFQITIKRHLRAAKQLSPFTDDQILKAVRIAKREYPSIWQVETLLKILTK